MGTVLTIATVNVNGIRAAVRKGMAPWLESAGVDVLCLQEVRADDATLAASLPGWGVVGSACEIKGRAGVAVASRVPIADVRVGLPLEGPVHTGRWIEIDIDRPSGPVTIVSTYVHSGEVDTPKQVAKYEFLEVMTRRLGSLAQSRAVVCGDLNIAHREVDIKNWKGNLKNAGFLPQERAYLDTWFDDLGWVDLGRQLGGDGPGPYTWWSWRGQAFDKDTGWRIDYQLATPTVAEQALSATVHRPPTYADRWTDHAPLLVEYDM